MTQFGTEAGAAFPSYLFAGFDGSFWNGLPVPVTIPGAGSCQVWMSGDVSVGTIASGATIAVPLPATPAAAGLTLFWQSVLLDPALTTALRLATSDRLATTVGS